MPLPAGFSALNQRDFRVFWSGQLVSLIGTWMQRVGQAWLVLVVVEPSRDHGDVEVLHQRGAQIGEQVSRRLQAGPVVLVEDEETRPAFQAYIWGPAPEAPEATDSR